MSEVSFKEFVSVRMFLGSLGQDFPGYVNHFGIGNCIGNQGNGLMLHAGFSVTVKGHIDDPFAAGRDRILREFGYRTTTTAIRRPDDQFGISDIGKLIGKRDLLPFGDLTEVPGFLLELELRNTFLGIRPGCRSGIRNDFGGNRIRWLYRIVVGLFAGRGDQQQDGEGAGELSHGSSD